MANIFNQLLDERDYLIADGAFGTNLMAMGLPPGQSPDLWNIFRPDSVLDLHHAFIEAGADIILTNTFGANHCGLNRNKVKDRAEVINLSGARLAREAADNVGRAVVVAGSMGPTGSLMAPLGPLSADEAQAAFACQAAALAEGGVDVLWLESFFDLSELAAALHAATAIGLPVTATMTFDTAGRTMMGVKPKALVSFLGELGLPVAAVGTNCGAGHEMLVDSVRDLACAIHVGEVIIAKGNSGAPDLMGRGHRYNASPEMMATHARLVRDRGARIIGGCCGTTPAHLQAMAQALEGFGPETNN